MSQNYREHVTQRKCVVEYWKGHQSEVDLNDILNSMVPVKGKSYHNPLRFMEIYGNLRNAASDYYCQSVIAGIPELSADVNLVYWQTIKRIFMPRIPGVHIVFDDNINQPPFSWKECDGRTLAINFTYNTNAIYRILSNLSEQGWLPADALDTYLDRACVVLSAVYKHRSHNVIKNINNNFNMFLISRVIELLVGKGVYDCDRQELALTKRSLQTSLAMVSEHMSHDTLEKMSIALGKGVSFIEKRLNGRHIGKKEWRDVLDVSFQYYGRKLAIDHRHLLLDKITNTGLRKGSFVLAAIFDDTTETVDDFLWIQDLIVKYPFFKVHIIVNTAQISINFSSHMLNSVLQSAVFSALAERVGSQLLITEIYCPFISFQTNYLPLSAKRVIDNADAVYVKGANFFETCQIIEKDVFHAFVVYGPISRKYTGLKDYDAVFVYIPAGQVGYIHKSESSAIITLTNIVKKITIPPRNINYPTSLEHNYG